MNDKVFIRNRDNKGEYLRAISEEVTRKYSEVYAFLSESNLKLWSKSSSATKIFPALNSYADECRRNSDRWYRDPKTGEPIKHNPGERMMLIISEVSEAFEGLRKDKMDDHLPHRKSVEVELVDALIRIFDFAGENGLDLDGAYLEKTAFNAHRPDHTHEARLAPHPFKQYSRAGAEDEARRLSEKVKPGVRFTVYKAVTEVVTPKAKSTVTMLDAA